MMIKIEAAPFTQAEKKKILEMGFVEADWGHPEVVLTDPVSFFKEQAGELTGLSQSPVRLTSDSKFRPGNDVSANDMFV